QRLVPGGADRLADCLDVVDNARCSVDLRDQDRLDGISLVRLEPGLDLGRPHGAAHVALQDLDLDAHTARTLAPAYRESAGLKDEDLVALAQDVGERGFP